MAGLPWPAPWGAGTTRRSERKAALPPPPCRVTASPEGPRLLRRGLLRTLLDCNPSAVPRCWGPPYASRMRAERFPVPRAAIRWVSKPSGPESSLGFAEGLPEGSLAAAEKAISASRSNIAARSASKNGSHVEVSLLIQMKTPKWV